MRQQLNGCRRLRGRKATGQVGAGLFASVFGLLFMIGFLLLASEVLISLQRASVVRAAALDAAHAGAEAGGSGGGVVRACSAAVEAAAATRAAELLGPAARVGARCRGDDAVAVSIDTPLPRLAGFLGPSRIRRSAEVRFETFRVRP